MNTYLTTDGLAERIHYEPSTIRSYLKDNVLIKGVHYIQPFGGRKVLYIWESIEKEMLKDLSDQPNLIPMANGGVCHGGN